LNVCSGSSSRARSRSRDQISRAESDEAAEFIAEGLIVEGVMTYRRRRLWKITRAATSAFRIPSRGRPSYMRPCGKINSRIEANRRVSRAEQTETFDGYLKYLCTGTRFSRLVTLLLAQHAATRVFVFLPTRQRAVSWVSLPTVPVTNGVQRHTDSVRACPLNGGVRRSAVAGKRGASG
jgi:hypothetical protein